MWVKKHNFIIKYHIILYNYLNYIVSERTIRVSGMKKEYLLVVLVVIVVFTGIFFFSKKKLSIQSLSYYRGGGDSVSSYRIELSNNNLSICKTDDNNDTDEKRFVVDDNLYNQINDYMYFL